MTAEEIRDWSRIAYTQHSKAIEAVHGERHNSEKIVESIMCVQMSMMAEIAAQLAELNDRLYELKEISK